MIDYRRKLRDGLANYQGAAFEILYWDGERSRFGAGEPQCRLHFKTKESLTRTLLETTLGLGEAYARGDVTVEGDLADALTLFGEAYLTMEPERLLTGWTRRALARTLPREKADVEHHYELGNNFFRFFLDEKLTYSCAYFRRPDDTLDAAQAQKVRHTLAKLHLQPGQRLLDLGCGWGHLMFEAAERYRVECVGITLSDKQAEYVREQAQARGLPVEVRTQHYLELDESRKWDRIVSVGMMEHVGESRADQFYDKVKALLAPRAICLLHCIAKMKEESGSDPFVEKYVFPGYWFFSLEGMTRRAVERGLNVMDVENLRRHYALTGRHWRQNFMSRYDEIKRELGFDDRFMRTWEFYLASGEAGVRIGHINLIQMLLSNGINDDYPWTREFLYQPG
jgi:cyclopropane-fatty-acyl-phospholipid synthase